MTKQRALERVSSLSRKISKSELSLDAWKWQRAEAMAEAADAGATQKEIGVASGMSGQRAGRHIAVAREWLNRTGSRPNYAEALDSIVGFDRDAAQQRTDAARTKRTLTDAPLEQVEQIVAGLPKERQQAIAAAVGDSYAKARQEFDERERNMTPAETREREEGRREVGRFTDGLVNTLSPMSIIGHLDQASEDFSAAMERGGLSYEQMHQIEQALDRFTSLFKFASEMAGDGERDA